MLEKTGASRFFVDFALAAMGRHPSGAGRTVTLATKVNPSIIGGVVARIGSTVYDGSVTTQLQKMKQRLVESV